MKTKIILMTFILTCIPSTMLAQNKYYDLDFERCDTAAKKIIQWKYQSLGTEFLVDPATSYAGSNSMFVNLKHTSVSSGVPFYFVLPKIFYQGLRTIDITVKIKFKNKEPNAGLWCLVKKDLEHIGSASTLKGNVALSVVPYTATAGASVAVIPDAWTPYNFTIKFDKDPNQVIIGLIVLKDSAWFDNIEIKLNGKPLNNLAFAVSSPK